MSRTVNGEFLFDPSDREVFRRQMWRAAEYCGVQILTYAILSNHFHLLVRVPKKCQVSDDEILRRYELLHDEPSKYLTLKLSVIRQALISNSPAGEAWRARQLRQMGDLSAYLKILKQRFSMAFNHQHGRFGTLWSERFKSVLVEPGGALQTIAAYIDLNCVRAGLASDPKDYRFCGYAEAVAGGRKARDGLGLIFGQAWAEVARCYRVMLFSTGSAPREHRGHISESAFKKVFESNGELRFRELLRCRVRYFTTGGVLGGKRFVEKVVQYRDRSFSSPQRSRMPVNAWGELFVYYRPRRVALG